MTTLYRGRRALQLENDLLRLTVLEEGGHLAELLHKPTGVNPLWTPPWPSIEPSTYSRERHPEYGADAESKLLSGLMGHNLCLDLFGGPSASEAAAGMTVHGEASVARHRLALEGGGMTQEATLTQAQLRWRRHLAFADPCRVRIVEEVENLAAWDRPVAWTQHVTLGDPFLEHGVTQFRVSATRSKVYETDFTGGKGYMRPGAEFDWPYVPTLDGGVSDLRTFTDRQVSAGFTTHLMDPAKGSAFFMAWSPRSGVLIGYSWKREDFPWLGIWEENRCRMAPPWSGRTVTRGMEFGASPMPESRRAMIERGRLFGVPAYRWLPARSQVRVEYSAWLTTATSLPEAPPF